MGKYCVHGKTNPHTVREVTTRYAARDIVVPGMTCIGPFVREAWDAAIIESERPEQRGKV